VGFESVTFSTEKIRYTHFHLFLIFDPKVCTSLNGIVNFNSILDSILAQNIERNIREAQSNVVLICSDFCIRNGYNSLCPIYSGLC